MSTLTLALQNQTTSQTVYAYITGLALDKNGALFLLQSDGKTAYYPESPSQTSAALAQNCAIPLGGPGNTVYVTIPHLAGARLWFSVNDTLDFLLNPAIGGGAPGLVEPSVTNSADLNINKLWDFCEFTFNQDQIYANISYVDFASLPVSLTLTDGSNNTQHVPGMDAGGFQQVISGLQQQQSADGQPWSSLIVNANGQPVRVLSPNSYGTGTANAFNDYYKDYVNQCWTNYANGGLTVDTQASWGKVTGTYHDGVLDFGNGITFSQPTASDVFSCSTGPFAGGQGVSDEQLNIGARLAAALNRSTLLSDPNQPGGEQPSNYYKATPTNQYARAIHAALLDGKGYAFPYDDVTPQPGNQAFDQSGYASAGNPQLLTVAVGGGNATTDVNEVAKRQTELIAKIPATDSTPAAGGDHDKREQPKPEQPSPEKPREPDQPDQPKTKAPGCTTSMVSMFKNVLAKLKKH